MATFKTTQIERERSDEDFTIECESGNSYTLTHPQSIHGRDLVDADLDAGAGVLMELVMGEDEYEKFLDEPEIDGFALDQIMRAWMEHYGLPTSPGNGRGSRRPSTATDRRSKQTSGSRRAGR